MTDLIKDIDENTPFIVSPPLQQDNNVSSKEHNPKNRDKPALSAESLVPQDWGYEVNDLNEEWAIAPIGSGVVYIQERPQVKEVDRVVFRTPLAFKELLSNQHTQVMGKKEPLTVTFADRWRADPKRRQYDGITFFPLAHGERLPRAQENYFNLWRGFSVEPRYKKDGWITLWSHIRENICGCDTEIFNWVLGWFAHMVQKPRERLGTAIVLQGDNGTGKSAVFNAFGKLVGAHYSLIDNAQHIVGNFNSHLAKTLFAQVEEAVWAGSHADAGVLKSLITAKSQFINPKGVDAFQVDNFVHVGITTNEDWAVPASAQERRFMVLRVKDWRKQDHAYFKQMHDELDDGGYEAFFYDLLQFDLSQVNLWVIPRTEALFDQQLESADFMDKWLFRKLCEGYLIEDEETLYPKAFGNAVSCSWLYQDYLDSADKVGIRRRQANNTFGKRLNQLIGGLETGIPKRRNSYGKREWQYILPELDVARERFALFYNQKIVWEKYDDTQSGVAERERKEGVEALS